MSQPIWGDDTSSPEIDWRMSAALQNVPRGDQDVAEVTNLAAAVRAWAALDPEHQHDALLTPERSIMIDGGLHASFTSNGIQMLAERLLHHGQD